MNNAITSLDDFDADAMNGLVRTTKKEIAYVCVQMYIVFVDDFLCCWSL